MKQLNEMIEDHQIICTTLIIPLIYTVTGEASANLLAKVPTQVAPTKEPPQHLAKDPPKFELRSQSPVKVEPRLVFPSEEPVSRPQSQALSSPGTTFQKVH